MLLRYQLLMPIVLLISSCTQCGKKQEIKDMHLFAKDTTSLPKQPVTPSTPIITDTLIINTKSATFYTPDSLQVAKRMKEVGEENFRAGADDYMYYMHVSIDYLEKHGIPVISAKHKKYISFNMPGQPASIVKLDTLKDLWGIYLFNPGQAPHFTDILAIEDEYKAYFK